MEESSVDVGGAIYQKYAKTQMVFFMVQWLVSRLSVQKVTGSIPQELSAPKSS